MPKTDVKKNLLDHSGVKVRLLGVPKTLSQYYL